MSINMNDILNAELKEDEVIDVVVEDNEEEKVPVADDALESAILNANRNSMTDDAKAQATLNASLVPIPSEQDVTAKVAEMIREGDIPVDIKMIINKTKRSEMIGNVLAILEKFRIDAVKQYKHDLFVEATRIGADTDSDDFKRMLRDADGVIKPYRVLPWLVVASLLVASKAITAITYVRGANKDNCLLLYRDYKYGVPRLWSEVDTSAAGDLSEISHLVSLLNANLTGTDLKKMKSLLMEWSNPKFVNARNTKIVFALNGVVDCRDIHWNEQLQMNVDKDGVIAKLYPYGTEEAEELIHQEYPLRYNCPWNFTPDVTVKLPVLVGPDGIEWNPIDGIKELFYDNEDYKVDYLMQNLQGTVRGTNFGRGTIHANKAGGAGGGNGKSTFLAIKTMLIGQQYVLSVSIPTMGKDDKALENLPESAAIFTHEGQSANGEKYEVDMFKAICRQDGPIFINRKHKKGVTVIWRGPTDWDMNEGRLNPKDGSDSVYRCVEIVEYVKSFGGSSERRYIKDDFVKRQEVLEYLFWYVLVKVPFREDDQYSPEVLEKLAPAKTAFRAESRPVMTFLDDVMMPSYDEEADEMIPEGIKMERVPVEVLYEIYKAWARKRGYTMTVTLRSFKEDAERWCGEHRDKFSYNPKKFRLTNADADGMKDDPAILEYISFLGEYVTDGKYTDQRMPHSFKWNDKTRRYTGGIFTNNAFKAWAKK